jgi:hypothetical protein
LLESCIINKEITNAKSRALKTCACLWPMTIFPTWAPSSMISIFNVRWTICGRSIANIIAFMLTLEIIEFLMPTLTFDRDGSNVLGAKSSHNNFLKCRIFHTKDIWQSYPFHNTCLWFLRSIFAKTFKQCELKTPKHGIVGPPN